MHDSVMAFVQRVMPEREVKGKRVLEVGSRNVNGSVRPLFSSAASYVGVDVVEGPGVDEIVDATDLPKRFPERFDIVICTEMLEHAEDWRAALEGINAVLKPRGRLVLTTRSPGFPHHEPPDYWRFTVADIRKALSNFDVKVESDPDPNSPGVLAVGIKDGRKRVRLDDIHPGKAPLPERPKEAYFHASQLYGGGIIRSFWPAQALSNVGWRTGWGDQQPPRGEFKTVVIHRPLDELRLSVVRWQKAAGVRVLVDEDDDLDHVDETKNEIAKEVWTPERREKHDQAIRESDGVIVTTDALAELYGPLAPEVHLVPNALPPWVSNHQYFKTRHDTAVRVGWAGITRTHLHDLEWIRPVAKWMLEGATFTTVGDPAVPVALGLNGQVEQWPWQMRMEDLYDYMARADIGIVPLQPCAFNYAKSALKVIEYLHLGKPVVVTGLREQAKVVRDGVEGFLADSPEDFAEKVRLLVRDQALREQMGKAAKERARAFTLDVRVQDWERALM